MFFQSAVDSPFSVGLWFIWIPDLVCFGVDFFFCSSSSVRSLPGVCFHIFCSMIVLIRYKSNNPCVCVS